jgi:RNA polymerase sigma-70 factor (ECF subfamily)
VDTDFELLDAWGAGDKIAGNRLFHRHFRSVFRFFNNKIDGGVEDLVQQTFLGCVEGRERFRRESTFKTYLLATARNVLYLEYRRRRRNDDRLDFATHSVADLAPSPSAIVAEVREQRLLLRALRSIPLDYQIALELQMWEGLTGPQMAVVLDLAEPGVRSRLHRAKQALRQRILQLEGAPAPHGSTSDDLERWAASLRELVAEPVAD